MPHQKYIKHLFFLGFILLLNACKDGEEPIFLVGEWNIDTYEIYYEENGEVITDLRYENVGEFILKENGIGNATIATPGSSLPQNQPIIWIYDDETQQITIDYDTMEGPQIYNIEVITLQKLQWTTIFNGAITTINLSKK